MEFVGREHEGREYEGNEHEGNEHGGTTANAAGVLTSSTGTTVAAPAPAPVPTYTPTPVPTRGGESEGGGEGHSAVSTPVLSGGGTTATPLTGATHYTESHDVGVYENEDGYEYHMAGGTSTAAPAGTLQMLSAPTTTTGTTSVIAGTSARPNFLEGGSGDAEIHGGSMNDIIVGGHGNNNINGGDGDDVIYGGLLNTNGAITGNLAPVTNVLNGGNGNNVLVASGPKTQALDSLLSANPGIVTSLATDQKMSSLVALANSSVSTSAAGMQNKFQLQSGSFHDSIYNFHAGSDVLEIQSGINGSDIRDLNTLLKHLSISGSNVSLDLGAGSSVTLVGVDVPHLSAANVAFM